MVQLNHQTLFENYGHAYPLLFMHDLYQDRLNSQVFQYIKNDQPPQLTESLLERIWQSIGKYARDMFRATVDMVGKLAWPVLLKLQEVPKYLDSMTNALKKIGTATGKKLINYVTAFLVGARQLWKDVKALFRSAGQPIVTSDAFKSVRAMTKELLSLLQSVGSGFVSAMHFLFKRIGDAVTAVKTMFSIAVENLADLSRDFGTSLLRIPNMVGSGVHSLHKKGVQMVIFAFTAVSDILLYGKHLKQLTIDYVTKFVKESHSFCVQLQQLTQRMNLKTVLQSMFDALMKTPVVKQILEWIPTLTNITNMFVRVFRFIRQSLARIAMTAMGYMNGFTTTLRNTVTNILSFALKHDRNTPDLIKQLQKTKQACQQLAKHPHITNKKRTRLYQAVRAYDNFEAQLEEHRRNYAENVLLRERSKALEHARLTSELFTQLYFERELQDAKQVDRLIRIRFGMSLNELVERASDIQLLLDMRLQDAMFDLWEEDESGAYLLQEQNKIGGLADLVWTKEERTKELERLKEELNEKQQALNDARLDPDYQKVLRYQTEIILRNQQSLLEGHVEDIAPDAFNSMNEINTKALKVLDEKYPIGAPKSIFELKQDIQDLKDQIKAINEGGKWKRVAKGVLSYGISLLFFGVAGYYMLHYSWQTFVRWNREKLMQSFTPLLEKAQYDPFLLKLVNIYIEKGNIQPDTTSVLADFQLFVTNIEQQLRHGGITYKDLYSTGGRYNDLLTGLLTSMQEHISRRITGTQISASKEKTTTEAVMDTFWSIVETPIKLLSAAEEPEPTKEIAIAKTPSDYVALTQNAMVNGLDFSARIAMSQSNLIGALKRGASAMKGATIEEREHRAISTFADTLSMFSVGLTPLIVIKKDVAVTIQQGQRSFLASMVHSIGYIWEATGAGGVSKEANVDTYMSHLKKGHAPYFAQLLGFYNITATTLLGCMQIGFLVIAGLSEFLALILIGELGQAKTRLAALIIDVGSAFTILTTGLYTKLVAQFFGRFTILGYVIQFALNILSIWFGGLMLPFLKKLFGAAVYTASGAFGFMQQIIYKVANKNLSPRQHTTEYVKTVEKTGTQTNKRVQSAYQTHQRKLKSARKKRTYVIQSGTEKDVKGYLCNVCETLQSQYQCAHCTKTYCSNGCQFLDWDTSRANHIIIQ